MLDFRFQRQLVGGDVDADVQHADHRAAGVQDEIVLGDELLAEEGRQADITFAGAQQRIGGVGAIEQGANRAFAVILLSWTPRWWPHG